MPKKGNFEIGTGMRQSCLMMEIIWTVQSQERNNKNNSAIITRWSYFIMSLL